MNGLDFLNLVIGLIFIYLIYSIACSTIWEIGISISNLRGQMLSQWLYRCFGKEKNELGKLIENHPMIKGLESREKSKPSYISSEVFTDVLLDLIIPETLSEDEPDRDITTIRKSIIDTPLLKDDMKGILLQYLSEAEGQLTGFKEKISKWYDEAQERLIGTYKRKLQWWIFTFSLALVGATNADTFSLCSYLYSNDDAREAIANKASLYVQDSSVIRLIASIDTLKINEIAGKSQAELINTITADFENLKKLEQELKHTDIPIGWKDEKIESLWGLVKKVCGLLLTALAVSMGSPFWFDLLSKVASLRSSGNKPRSLLDEIDADEVRKLLEQLNVREK